MKICKCRNCGETPVVVKGRGYFEFVLSHPSPTVCPTDFHLESHQHSEEACIKDWNNFNQKNSTWGKTNT